MTPVPTLKSVSAPSPARTRSAPSLRVVAIGGGTGLSTLLRGLKRYVPATIASRRATDAAPRVPSAPAPTPNPAFSAQPCIDRRAESTTRLLPCLIHDLAAVVTVTDDGGSSGRLREDLNRSEERRVG